MVERRGEHATAFFSPSLRGEVPGKAMRGGAEA